MTRQIIVDTDPGQDDAVALLLALASPDDLDVAGITTVAGNVPLPLTSRNALMICELAGRTDVGVYAGAARPMRRELYTAEYVHGPSGLDGADLPEPQATLQADNAMDFIVGEVLGAEPQSITLCALGPLTNLGMALSHEPRLSSLIHEIVLMGGGFFEGGNTTPAAEFNIYVDPHAAEIVFGSGIPITMMPLDVTHQAIAGSAVSERFRALGTATGRAVAGMLDFYGRHDRQKYGLDGAPLHDPCVVAYLLEPSLFDGKHCNVEIETSSPLTMGMTVVDWWGVTDRPPNALVMNSVDDAGYFDLLVERLGRL